ncbi:hypothetical protein E3V55_02515 [Candidatus Marinimicrobia bacterium MT.SAG.3]|nr:hypothetical protein E3V55_02515 [Candidatus Marinimicrobia bacterium MT.SAG.3]
MRLKPYFSITLTLTAMLLVGCSQQDTSLNAPEIASVSLAKGGNPGKPDGGGAEEATFAVTFSGDVSNATGEPHTWTRKLREGGNMISTPFDQPITLDMTFFKTALNNGGECFKDGTYAGGLLIGEAKKNEPGTAKVMFWFEANEVSYLLEMFGNFVVEVPWLLDVGETTTVKLSAWEMETESNKFKSACTGNGPIGNDTFSSTVSIKRTG